MKGQAMPSPLSVGKINPPPDEPVSDDDFGAAIGKVETKLGLTDQPRAIVYHENNGRRHCHAVWSRIDIENMKAIQLSFTKKKLMDISRELYLEHGWEMPAGLRHRGLKDPRNFSLAEWQQAKLRNDKVGRAIREIIDKME